MASLTYGKYKSNMKIKQKVHGMKLCDSLDKHTLLSTRTALLESKVIFVLVQGNLKCILQAISDTDVYIEQTRSSTSLKRSPRSKVS